MSKQNMYRNSPGKLGTVIIVGAGIAGAMMGALLERAGVDYILLEGRPYIRHLGTAVTLSAGALTVLEQLGLIDAFNKISSPIEQIAVHQYENENKVSPYAALDFSQYEKRSGYHWRTVGRHELHELIMGCMKPERIHLNKRVKQILQSSTQAIVSCQDGSTYKGTIVVGADGVRSQVRTHMQADLKSKNKLPKVDELKAIFNSVAVIGITQPLDTSKFPAVRSPFCVYDTVVHRGTEYAWTTFTTPGDRYSWFLWRNTKRLTAGKRKHLVTGKQEITDEFKIAGKDLPTTFGPKLGELMANTQPQDYTRVVIEEKTYETWHSRRLVLIGDSCHKVHPAGGLAANHAIMDAVVLCNTLYNLESNSEADVEKAFQAYYSIRYNSAKEVTQTSHLFGAMVLCQTWQERIPHDFLLRVMPTPIYQMLCDRLVQWRPQGNFMPHIKDRGSVAPKKQQKVGPRGNNKSVIEAKSNAGASNTERGSTIGANSKSYVGTGKSTIIEIPLSEE